MGNNLPLFSMMSRAELSAWAWKYKEASPSLAVGIFPGRPRGYVGIVQSLAQLALHLSAAKRLKEEGEHRKAIDEEEAAEAIRAELPDFARPS